MWNELYAKVVMYAKKFLDFCAYTSTKEPVKIEPTMKTAVKKAVVKKPRTKKPVK
jgi:hypothetical protein